MNILSVFHTQTPVKTLPDLRPGLTVRVHQKIREGNKTRIQVFEGLIIAHKHGTGPNGTITVRKISHGVGVERIFPIHLPTIEKFETIKVSKVRRAKLYYLRTKTVRETKKKMKLLDLKAFLAQAPQPTTPSTTPTEEASDILPTSPAPQETSTDVTETPAEAPAENQE